jgi:hypothetical protein
LRPAALRPSRVEKRVPQNPEQVSDVVVAADESRPREHARVRLLDEVLGVLP